MRRASRYALVAGAVWLPVTIVLAAAKALLWGTTAGILLRQIQEALVWPFARAAQPLLQSTAVPLFSISGRAIEAAAWREVIIYGVLGTLFYALIAGAIGFFRDRRRPA